MSLPPDVQVIVDSTKPWTDTGAIDALDGRFEKVQDPVYYCANGHQRWMSTKEFPSVVDAGKYIIERNTKHPTVPVKVFLFFELRLDDKSLSPTGRWFYMRYDQCPQCTGDPL